MTPPELRAIDHRIAAETMQCRYGTNMAGFDNTPRFTASIRLAWEVVDALALLGYRMELWTPAAPGRPHVCAFHALDLKAPLMRHQATADTAPLAICLAALEAVSRKP